MASRMPEITSVVPTGYSQAGLQQQIEQESDFETFFAQAPVIHPGSSLVKGAVCGVRVEG